MIIPSIDIMGGCAVQLVGGREKVLDAGDPVSVAEHFAVAGELAVIDLDGAFGRGDNTAIIHELVRRFPCRVGGGIRDVETARKWFDAGATRVILGTAAVPEILSQLPAQRVIAALDAVEGEVVVDGWRRPTGWGILERMAKLKGFVNGFLVTFVEREGRMGGVDLDRVAEVVAGSDKVRVTVAGGITTGQEIAAIDRLGADAQVGMALYTGHLNLAEAIASPLRSDRPDGLWPTVVVDRCGLALGLAWSNSKSVREAIRIRRGVYHSRFRGLWVKGMSSGNTQELLRVDLDCDRDTLRFTVNQQGSGFCHTGTRTCWGEAGGISALFHRLEARCHAAPEGSYTRRLLGDPQLLAAKLTEEAAELSMASREEVIAEAADLIYFVLVAMVRAGVKLRDVEAELNRRSFRLSRRPGNAKTSVEGNQ